MARRRRSRPRSTNLTGPAGATYTLADGIGNYGTVPDATTGPCTDCYMVGVDNPSRPPGAALGRLRAGVHHARCPGAAEALEAAHRRQLHGRADEQRVLPLRRDPAAPQRHRRLRRDRLLPEPGHDPRTDGGLRPGREGRGRLRSARLRARRTSSSTSAETSPFCRFIEELARRGVVSRMRRRQLLPDGTRSPASRWRYSCCVTLDPTLNPPACVPPNDFADVPETSPFCRWIEELTRRAVVSGCGGAPTTARRSRSRASRWVCSSA